MTSKIFSISTLTFLVAISLSTIAAYYSIIGLTAIFAAAVVPVIIMGAMLEIAKITATIWLKKYWYECGFLLKLYLVTAVLILALITSMGIFGFLSKSHLDQNVPMSDISAQVSLIDEKIKTQRENIEFARQALAQLDRQVDERLSRGTTEQSAERAVTIRRQQQAERNRLQTDIANSQKIIQKLNEERAPIASQLRKVEAEVGPIKYIAALIYGNEINQNLLEEAVRYVIILLVIVFDPLAIVLVLAAYSSYGWMDRKKNTEVGNNIISTEKKTEPFVHFENTENKEPEVIEQPIVEQNTIIQPEQEIKPSYLEKKWNHFPKRPPVVAKIDDTELPKVETAIANLPDVTVEKIQVDTKIEESVTKIVDNTQNKDYFKDTFVITEDKSKEVMSTLHDNYVLYDNKNTSIDALKASHPELFITKTINLNFGSDFSDVKTKGDIFVKTDVFPNVVYKYDGSKWVKTDKNKSDTYLFNTKYIIYLVEKINSGEYDIEMLTEAEKFYITEYLEKNNS